MAFEFLLAGTAACGFAHGLLVSEQSGRLYIERGNDNQDYD